MIFRLTYLNGSFSCKTFLITIFSGKTFLIYNILSFALKSSDFLRACTHLSLYSKCNLSSFSWPIIALPISIRSCEVVPATMLLCADRAKERSSLINYYYNENFYELMVYQNLMAALVVNSYIVRVDGPGKMQIKI